MCVCVCVNEYSRSPTRSACLLVCLVLIPQFHWLFTTACRYICIYTNAHLSTNTHSHIHTHTYTHAHAADGCHSRARAKRAAICIRCWLIPLAWDRWGLPLCLTSVCHRISGRILSSVSLFVSIKSP